MIPIFMALVGWSAKSANERNFKALARLSNQFLDLLKGMAILQLNGQIRAKTIELEQSSEQYRKKTMEVLRIAFLSSAVLEFFSAIAIAMLATYLGLSLLGDLHIGYYGQQPSLKIALFILLLAPEFYLPLRQLGNFYHAKQQAVIVGERLANCQQALIKSSFKQDTAPFHTRCHFSTLRFQNVSMKYDVNDYNSLVDINLEITAGEHIAIVGQSGAGKTTLLNLMLGFILPNNGIITIDDIATPDYDLAV
ncbi:MAG: ATP-binding cassette domain-containing protein, partial [Gammaproteobacteria bacterium]